MELKENVALITGASAGIGEACARMFAAQGARLVLVARRINRLEKISDTLTERYGVRCYPIELDVGDRVAVFSRLGELPDEFREVTILINNAGGAKGLEPVANGNSDDWDWMLNVNVRGLLNVTRAILPGMIERGRGHIVNIGSIAGRMVYPNGTVYCAAKFAERAISQGLLMELISSPVRVTTIDPGMVKTEFSKVRFKGDIDRAEAVYRGLKPLTADDVAEAVRWVVSQPPHFTVSEMVIVPTAQASPYHTHRDE